MHPERRQNTRVPACFVVEYEYITEEGSRRGVAHTRNVSVCGLGLALHGAGPGGRVCLRFRLPATGERVEVAGQVAWVARRPSGPGWPYEAGVHLTEIAKTDGEKLALHVQHRLAHAS